MNAPERRVALGRPVPPATRRVRRDVERLRARLRERPTVELEIVEVAHRFEWAVSETPPYTTVVGLTVGASCFDVYLDDIGFSPVLAVDLLAALPEASRAVCAGHALAEPIRRIERLAGRAVALVSLAFARLETAPPEGLPFTVTAPGSAVTRHGCVVPRDASGLRLIEAVLDGLPETPRPARGGVSSVRVVLGGTRLSRHDWHALGPGWAVVVTRPAMTSRGIALVGREGGVVGRCEVRRGESLARCVETGAGMKLTIDEGPEPVSGDDDAEPMIELAFELGRARVDEAWLRGFEPGAVLELDRPIESYAVRIRCAGRLVGIGELLDLDGAMAVRITSLTRHG